MNGAELLENLKAFDIAATCQQVLKDNESSMAELNREQLHEGLNASGEVIGDLHPYRNPDYAFFKNSLNPSPGLGNPDLNLTGSHYSGLYAKVEGKAYEMGSTDSKSAALEKKYGSKEEPIYGLTDESRVKLNEEHLEPEWQNAVEKSIGLTFNK